LIGTAVFKIILRR